MSKWGSPSASARGTLHADSFVAPQGSIARAILIAMTDQGVLAREIATFEAHCAQLISTAAGKYVLVYGDEVSAIYDTERQAISDGRSRFGYVPILIERISDEGEADPPVEPANSPGQLGESMLTPISWRQPGGALHHFGPVTKITIGVTGAGSEAVARSGKAVPAPAHGWALIDTGSTFSHLDEKLIAELGLQPVGRIDLAGSDSVRTELRYDAKMVFEDGMSAEIIASSARLRRPRDSRIPGYDALIGRDVLANAIITYDGIHETIALQFQAPGPDTANSAGDII